MPADRIHFKQRWGRACCQFEMNGVVVPVTCPIACSPDRGTQFEFQLPGGDSVVATIDNPPATTICVNETPAAVITPVMSLSQQRFGHRPYPLQVAEVAYGGEAWPLVGTVYCGWAMNHFRVLTESGARACYWKKTALWGRGGATLLVSRRVDRCFLAVAISATVTSMLPE
ncbi:hypothetical protein Pla123a_14690 [Posidoniimonas polymericola]|uniref:Uncharacterized protein n=2 Tax=Posidoniimonas polymericola TaxID=2528002 RepID=A0A5C5YSB1_9BACT|nr:hypothetical protein Pla123a_14690 [Posidoniimonas polymericola]